MGEAMLTKCFKKMGKAGLARCFKVRPLNRLLEMVVTSSTAAKSKYPMCIRAQLEVRALAAFTDQHRISADAGTVTTVGGRLVMVVEGDEEQIPELCLDEKLPGHMLPNGPILLTLLFQRLPEFPSGKSFTAHALLMMTG